MHLDARRVTASHFWSTARFAGPLLASAAIIAFVAYAGSWDTAAGGAPGCALQAITASTINGELTTTDCRSVVRTFSYADRNTFSGTAGQQVSIFMSSIYFDSYLVLRNSGGTVMVND